MSPRLVLPFDRRFRDTESIELWAGWRDRASRTLWCLGRAGAVCSRGRERSTSGGFLMWCEIGSGSGAPPCVADWAGLGWARLKGVFYWQADHPLRFARTCAGVNDEAAILLLLE